MDVFALDDWLLGQYMAFARSFVRIRSEELREKVDLEYAGRRFWPEPLIQLNPHFEAGGSIQGLVGSGGLDPDCAKIFRDHRARPDAPDPSLKLRRHQEQAIGLALDGKSFVVTTGTGSGKSLCFFIPIVDTILKAKRAGEGARTRAIIVYPMNALANSQMEELKKYVAGADDALPVTFARYTGQENQDERDRIKDNPPDILLTNFMMLELLMTRQSKVDRRVIDNCQGLQFVVLDELHTYRGRQGADVAMLMRRLRSRIGDPERPPVCIGTSATMASEGDEGDRNQVVAEVASRLFGTPIARDAIVTETLRRVTDASRSADRGLPDLAAAVDGAAEGAPYTGRDNAELGIDPLAIWVETRVGLSDVHRKPRRASPQSLDEIAKCLSNETGRDEERCRKALKAALLAFSMPEKDRGVAGGADEPLFAFKLHQFISGAGRLYTTLDPAGARTVTFDGQIYDPDHPTKRLFAAHFCRNCGQEHHPVTLIDDDGNRRFEKREIDDVPLNEDDDPDGVAGVWGFLMPEPVDGDFAFEGRDEDYPDPWLEETRAGEIRLKGTYRRTRAELLMVRPDGTCGGGRRAWFLPGRFKFCPACGDHHSDSTRDINRLASLSAEGRSSATTIIITAILRWMNGTADMRAETRKLLAFTDNRQDAALQAGHFNDFIFVTLLRGAILAALSRSGPEGCREDEIGQAVQRMLGFTSANRERRTEWLIEPELKGGNLMDAERTMRDVLTHRFWVDQRRGWRYTNPNLEQLGLIAAVYAGLDEMVRDEALFAAGPDPLRIASPDQRAAAAEALFGIMRQGLAVETDALDRLRVESVASRSRAAIKAPWCLDDERPRAATTFMPRPPARRDMIARDEDLIVRGSPQSAVGRILRGMPFGPPGSPRPTANDLVRMVETLLRAGIEYGLTVQVASPVGGEGWRLNPSSILFRTADGAADVKRDNRFFRGLYEEIAGLLRNGGGALFGLESREHTAQVDSERRRFREARFRYGEDDKEYLDDKAERLRELREDKRFLPILFCSPTMELGIDISAMNVVYMRNAPPTPANYAQRSGRAGRSGQAALVLAYCAAQSPHDQYFFQQPKAMVDGVVRPPSIDLTNPDLVQSHLQAEWLAASGIELDASISANLDMGAPGKPLLPAIVDRASDPSTAQQGERRIGAVLSALSADYAGNPPEWFTGVEELARRVTREAPARFATVFDRWRDLLASAERQVDDAARSLRDYSISQRERQAAELRQRDGNNQIAILLGGTESQGADFYVYRYLATEGFLPGYNFPRLPLMAYVPGADGGEGRRYIQRARFLAISEFGPGSLVYHEGRAFRVDRALLKGAGGGPDGMLATFATSVCPMCGAGHDGEAPEACHVCGHDLHSPAIIQRLYRIENVGTRQAERITANDEDRRRQGFDLQTTFSFDRADGVVTRVLADATGDVLTATFAPAATVRRINKGLRRRRNENDIGFWIDPRTGRWAAGDTDDRAPDPTRARQQITPVVEDRKNALLLRFPLSLWQEAGTDVDKVLTTLQHALARGIETVYQLEEGEILGEPTPSRKDRRALFFYEAAEGGAGALSRLVNEADGFRDVARAALTTMHIDEASIDAAGADPKALRETSARCVAGCYRCLLSYFNQPDHESIDRRNESVLRFLLRLAASESRSAGAGRGNGLPGCPPHDGPVTVAGVSIPWFWRAARVAAAEEADTPDSVVDSFAAKGVDLYRLPRDAGARSAAIATLAVVLKGRLS
ncbi:DEAD/DEAH box helicase [Azospirillum sp. ST 5-10]|uniref:DEAD/DEAH box helicase n=1 Tax=unclassified Azospirillum TaxID=2630922 RepID=UPI003F4A165C